MPTYQYRCTACAEELEVVQKFTDDALSVCPICQGHLRKVFTAVGVVFKGSGFYKTDSRASKSGAPTASTTKESASASSNEAGSSSSDSSSGDSSSSSGESKPDSGSSGPSESKRSGDPGSSTESRGSKSSGGSTGGGSTGDGSKVA
jgi:putative FmdB family regulatory protein